MYGSLLIVVHQLKNFVRNFLLLCCVFVCSILLCVFSSVSPSVFFQIILNGAYSVDAIGTTSNTTGCIAGTTRNTIPLLTSTFKRSPDGFDVYVICMSQTGEVIFSTYFGGAGTDQANDIVVNDNTVIVSGSSEGLLSTLNGATVSSSPTANATSVPKAFFAMFDISSGKKKRKRRKK